MNDLYNLLQTIRKRPEIYLGKPSLELLYAFINGYKSHKCYDPMDDCLDGFNEYVSDHYNLYTDHNWAGMIQFFSFTEQGAFNDFFTLFDSFMKEKAEG